MASKRRIRRKACTGKRRFESGAAAEKARWGSMCVYRCQFCKGFHMGHLPRAKRIARRREMEN